MVVSPQGNHFLQHVTFFATSPSLWFVQHIIAHHPYTNMKGFDPDLGRPSSHELIVYVFHPPPSPSPCILKISCGGGHASPSSLKGQKLSDLQVNQNPKELFCELLIHNFDHLLGKERNPMVPSPYFYTGSLQSLLLLGSWILKPGPSRYIPSQPKITISQNFLAIVVPQTTRTSFFLQKTPFCCFLDGLRFNVLRFTTLLFLYFWLLLMVILYMLSADFVFG